MYFGRSLSKERSRINLKTFLEKLAMKIMMIASEMTPYAKAGGLGDVVSSLSKKLAEIGHDVRVVIPYYGSIERKEFWVEHKDLLMIRLGEERCEYCRIWEGKHEGVVLYLLEQDNYFGGKKIYEGDVGGKNRDGERFVVLSRGGLDLCYQLGWIPDMIHCHDWMTGLVPVYLKTMDKEKELGRVGSVLTLHNMEYQGVFGEELIDFSGLRGVLSNEGMEGVNMLRVGIENADKLTTVSEQYAREITEVGMGCGLEEVLKKRGKDLVGIVNGVDVDVWDPLTDLYLPENYGVWDMKGKEVCKSYLQHYYCLEEDRVAPLFGVIARMYWQKGLDIFVKVVSLLIEKEGAQVVVLGEGDRVLEEQFLKLGKEHKGRMGVRIGYNEELSHVVESGIDYFVMPSRFEPCGLTQLYSMIYGAVPIVREVGGLKDTVVDYRIEGGTGFLFKELNEEVLYETLRKACEIYKKDPVFYGKLRENGMKRDFSWEEPAKKYEMVYKKVVDFKRNYT